LAFLICGDLNATIPNSIRGYGSDFRIQGEEPILTLKSYSTFQMFIDGTGLHIASYPYTNNGISISTENITTVNGSLNVSSNVRINGPDSAQDGNGLLSIKSNSNGMALTLEEYSGGIESWSLGMSAAGDLTFHDSGDTTPVISFNDTDGDANNTNLQFIFAEGTATIKASGGSVGELAFNTYGSERMRIDTIGKIGIGTPEPSGAVHVSASNPELWFTDSNVGYETRIKADSGLGSIWIDADVNNEVSGSVFGVRFNGSGTESFIVNDDGNVGIGTVSPDARLHVVASTATALTLVGGDITGTVVVDRNGTLELGGQATYHGVLSYYGSGDTEMIIANGYDDDNSAVSIKTRTLGTAVTNLTATGDGLITISSRTVMSKTPEVTINKPTIAFGDGDTGIGERADDQFTIIAAGTQMGYFDANSFVSLRQVGGAYVNMLSQGASVPTFTYAGDTDSGLGWNSANNIFLATGGSEVLSITGDYAAFSSSASFAGGVTASSLTATGDMLAVGDVTANAFYGDGSNITGISSQFELIYEDITSVDSNKIEITGLDSNTDGAYYMVIRTTGTNSGGVPYAYINEDYTASNYYSQYLYANSASVSGVRANTPRIGNYVQDGYSTVIHIVFTQFGNRASAQSVVDSGGLAASSIVFMSCAMNPASDVYNITAIGFGTDNVGNALGAGTEVRVYAFSN